MSYSRGSSWLKDRTWVSCISCICWQVPYHCRFLSRCGKPHWTWQDFKTSSIHLLLTWSHKVREIWTIKASSLSSAYTEHCICTGSLNFQEYVRTFQVPLEPFYSPRFPFEVFSQLLICPNWYHYFEKILKNRVFSLNKILLSPLKTSPMNGTSQQRCQRGNTAKKVY